MQITIDFFKEELHKELGIIESEFGVEAYANRRFSEAAGLLTKLVESPSLAPFLTLEAYHLI